LVYLLAFLLIFNSCATDTTLSWSWSYGSWIYNYMCNQCLSPLEVLVRTPFMARYTRYNIM
jgi:hypothetical protein